jgi:hypothetical protein
MTPTELIARRAYKAKRPSSFGGWVLLALGVIIWEVLR